MRQKLDGEPEGGWSPEERVEDETALRAYTVDNAWPLARRISRVAWRPADWWISPCPTARSSTWG
jgi:hypothetical protein